MWLQTLVLTQLKVLKQFGFYIEDVLAFFTMDSFMFEWWDFGDAIFWLLFVLYSISWINHPYAFLLVVPVVDAVGLGCPHCHGNAPSCTFMTDSKCPLITTVATNASIIAGVATVALTLVNLIRPRFLRAFPSSSLDAIAALVKRPVPGSSFVIESNTKLKDILHAIASGRFTMELAFIRLGELIEELDPSVDGDKVKIARLESKVKLLGAAKDVNAFVSTTTSMLKTDLNKSYGGGRDRAVKFVNADTPVEQFKLFEPNAEDSQQLSLRRVLDLLERKQPSLTPSSSWSLAVVVHNGGSGALPPAHKAAVISGRCTFVLQISGLK